MEDFSHLYDDFESLLTEVNILCTDEGKEVQGEAKRWTSDELICSCHLLLNSSIPSSDQFSRRGLSGGMAERRRRRRRGGGGGGGGGSSEKHPSEGSKGSAAKDAVSKDDLEESLTDCSAQVFWQVGGESFPLLYCGSGSGGSNVSLISSSSSFNSCESVLENILDRSEGSSPVRFHSCNSVNNLSDESLMQGGRDVVLDALKMESAEVPILWQWKTPSDSSTEEVAVGTDSQVNTKVMSDSDSSDMKPYHALQAEWRMSQNLDSKIGENVSNTCANASSEGTWQIEVNDDTRGLQITNAFKLPQEIFLSTEQSKETKCLFYPNSCEGEIITEGCMSYSFPSAVPNATTVSAKRLRATRQISRLPLRGVQNNDAFLPSGLKVGNFVYGAHEEGQVVTDTVSDVSCEYILEECQSERVDALNSDSIKCDVDYSSYEFGDDTPGRKAVLKVGKMQSGSLSDSYARKDASGNEFKPNSLITKADDGEKSAISSEGMPSKYFQTDASVCETEFSYPGVDVNLRTLPISNVLSDTFIEIQELSKDLLKTDECESFAAGPVSNDRGQLKWWPNLYRASPVFVTDEGSEEEEMRSPVCSLDRRNHLLNSCSVQSASDTFSKRGSDFRLRNLNRNFAPSSPYSIAKATPFSSVALANNEINVNITSNIKKSECQRSKTFGTDSGFVVSDDFGLVEETYFPECLLKDSVGHIQFSVGPKLWNFPLLKLASNEGHFTEETRSSNLILCLATSGKYWRLGVCYDGCPAVLFSDKMAKFSDSKKDEDSLGRPNFASKLYGFTIVPTANSRVRSLVPLFASKNLSKSDEDLRTSITSSVTLRPKKTESFHEGHRNSAACDVEMYRVVDSFIPVNDKESYIKDNVNVANPLKVCKVSFQSQNNGDEPKLQNPSEELSPQNLKPPPTSVLRSKSETKIKPYKREKQEGTLTPERSNSLNGSTCGSSTNLSSFKGMTSPLEDDASDVTKAAAFISSVVQQSLCPEKLSARINVLKGEEGPAVRSQPNGKNIRVSASSCSDNLSSNTLPSEYGAHFRSDTKNEFVHPPSLSRTSDLPVVPSLKNAIAVNTIVSHLNATNADFSTARHKPPFTCAGASCTTSSSQFKLGASLPINPSETSPVLYPSVSTSRSSSFSTSPLSSMSSVPSSSPHPLYSFQPLKSSVSSSFSSHVSPFVGPSSISCTTSSPTSTLSTCAPTSSFVPPSSNSLSSPSQNIPSFTASSAEPCSFQISLLHPTTFAPSLPSTSVVTSSLSTTSVTTSAPATSSFLSFSSKYSLQDSVHKPISCSLTSDHSLTTVTPSSADMPVLPVTSLQNQRDSLAFKDLIDANISSSGIGANLSQNDIKRPCGSSVVLTSPKADHLSNSDFIPNTKNPIVEFNKDKSVESVPPAETTVSWGMTLRSRTMDMARQLGGGTQPTRHTYSTKFPLDIICQGRLLEVKRRTAPPGEFSTPPVEGPKFSRHRLSSVGQVQPPPSLQKEAYPKARSMSTGRMEFGRRKTPLSSFFFENYENEERRENKEETPYTQSTAVSDANTNIVVGHSSTKPETIEAVNFPSGFTDTGIVSCDSNIRKETRVNVSTCPRPSKLRNSHSFNVKLTEGKDEIKLKGSVNKETKEATKETETLIAPLNLSKDSVKLASVKDQDIKLLETTTTKTETTLTEQTETNQKKEDTFLNYDKISDFTKTIVTPIFKMDILFPLIKQKHQEQAARLQNEEEEERLRCIISDRSPLEKRENEELSSIFLDRGKIVITDRVLGEEEEEVQVRKVNEDASESWSFESAPLNKWTSGEAITIGVELKENNVVISETNEHFGLKSVEEKLPNNDESSFRAKECDAFKLTRINDLELSDLDAPSDSTKIDVEVVERAKVKYSNEVESEVIDDGISDIASEGNDVLKKGTTHDVTRALSYEIFDSDDAKTATDHKRTETEEESVTKEGNENVDVPREYYTHQPSFVEVSLPEPVKSLKFVVEEVLDFIDERTSSYLGKARKEPKHREEPLLPPPSFTANNGSIAENIPTSNFPLAASLSFPLSPPTSTSLPTVKTTVAATTTTTTVAAAATTTTTTVKITAEGKPLDNNQPTLLKEHKTEFLSPKEGELSGEGPIGVKCPPPCQAVLSSSSKSEDESPPTDGDVLLASASASSTGSALSWSSAHGPVARRDLFPLEDEEAPPPPWQALMAVNRHESDEGRSGYESDDDFESMDVEMRRLEEKLRKFERELGISSGEDFSTVDTTTIDANKSNNEEVTVPRLRQEDIDVLRSFSLPDVYPPVNVLRTKHLSLMKKEESLFDEDSENEFRNSCDASTDSIGLLFVKPVKKKKTGERRIRSLDLQKLMKNKRGSKFSVDVMVTSQKSDDVHEILEKATEFKECDADSSIFMERSEEDARFDTSVEDEYRTYHVQTSKEKEVEAEDGYCLCSEFSMTEESHFGYLWREEESDMTALDFDALEDFSGPGRKDSLFFIFEDDDEPEEQDPYFETQKKEYLPISPSIDDKVYQHEAYSFSSCHPYDDSVSQDKKKRDISLVSAFKNSFRKAAKYLGPNSFTKPKEEDTDEIYLNSGNQTLNNNLFKTSYSSNIQSDFNKNRTEPKFCGKYNVPSAQVQNNPLVESDFGDASCSSGEYHASPAVCVVTSEEEQASMNSQKKTKNNNFSYLPPPDKLSENFSAKVPRTTQQQHGCWYDTPIKSPPSHQTEDAAIGVAGTKDHRAPNVPPPIPPRRSLLHPYVIDTKEECQCEMPQNSVKNDDLSIKISPNYPLLPPSDAAGVSRYSMESGSTVSHKPTSLKQLKRKQQERIESQKAEAALEASGCTFCVGVPVSRGRSDQPGNHNRHPSPHPRALPDRRTWPPRARSEEQVANSHAWLDAERVWLVHRGGFCAGRTLEESEEGRDSPLQEGKIRLQLEHSKDAIEVDEDDVEKANPPTFDRCEDLSHLRYLNESSILHTLRQRYGSNLIHTYAGSAMVVINPTTPLAIYSEKVIQMFKGCKLEDMPPHIYSVGQSTYRDLINTRRDQSIVFLGRSGAGKTTNFRHVLHYLALAAGACNKILTVEKLNAISTLLEAFGNSRTVLNTNATRFTQIFSLDFDHSGQIASASVQVYMPEKMRVVRRPQGEPNYHILYQLLSGANEDLKNYLGLDNLTDSNLFLTPLQRTEDKQRAGIAWARIRAALDVLKVSEDEQKAIWSVLASIYHIGTAGAVKVGNTNKFQFANPAHAQKAASLLGTSVEELARTIFTSPPSSATARSTYRTGSSSPTDRIQERPEGLEAVEGIAAGLYVETFNAIVALINRCISTSAHTVNSILVVDSPGFQNPASCGRNTGATFSDLCHNYAQERLQMLFHDATFTAQTDRYAQEHIEYGDVTDELGTPAPLISLLDKPSSNSVVRTSQVDLREADRRGLLWLLDEEAIFPGASDQSFLQRMFTHYGDREYSSLIQKGNKSDHFILHHFQGTNPVTYSTQGWLKASRENPVTRQAAALLQESNMEILSRLFVFSRGPVSNTISGSVVGIEGSQSLRRASSIRRAFTTGTASIKRKSVCLQVKFTVDGIIETLRRTKLKFVHCILPQHNAGLCDLKGSPQTPNKVSFEDVLLNVPLVRSQIRGCQILDALRLHKQGFPEHLQYPEFRRRFSVLAPSEARAPLPVKDEKAAAEAILPHLDLDASSYRLGLSQIFFRTGTISRLEEQRDLVLTDTIVRLQAVCRGVLARRRMRKRKVQETAIRCIQKNVRKFMAVRDWPWWRLLVRVTPLLNVHRTEEELRSTKEELESVRSRLEKAENERQDLKYENEKLEARLSAMEAREGNRRSSSAEPFSMRLTEVTADLSEGHNTAQLASERIEAEQAERMRLEKEVTQLQTDIKRMTTSNDKLEMEKLRLKNEVLQHAELNGDIDDETADASLYKRKYEWCLRETEVLKKQLKQQQEDDLDQLLILKKQLEKKVADAYEETDEQRQVVAQMKKKSQRLQAEMNDLKILLEEQTSRNNLLEKKQRKFDQDMQSVMEDQRNERLSKEKTQREKDQILSEKYSYEQDVATLKLELELKDEKLAALTRELDDLNFTGKTEEEVALLKKAKHDLELRVKDQEEELDDLAGQVQMLESAKIRLEMSIEQMRKENRKELAQRDEEVEEVRMSAQKKIKGLEAQLETEHEERTQLVREKHDLERRLVEAHNRSFATVDEEAFHRVKKELKKTKALLKDTQTMLEKTQSEGSNKLLLRQLKTQLEDAEFAKTAAIKAKQCTESDFSEVQNQFDEALRAKKDVEDRLGRVTKEKAEVQTQLEESEEEVAEVMKKYKATVSQLSVDQINISEQAQLIADLEHDKQVLQEKLSELSSKVEVLEGETANIHTQRRLQMKIKELESKLDLESTTRQRLESQITRLKDQVDRMSTECDAVRLKEAQAVDHGKKMSRQLREAKEDVSNLQQKLTDSVSRKQEMEKQYELAESEIVTLKSDLKLAFKRIEDLQQALQGDISDSDSEISDSGSESETSLTTFLTATTRPDRTPNTTLRTTPTDTEQESKVDIIGPPVTELMSVIKEDIEDDYKESFA